MALTEGDKAICRELAAEVIKEAIVIHLKSCPIGQKMKLEKAKLMALVIGITIGSGLGGGSIVMLVLKVFA